MVIIFIPIIILGVLGLLFGTGLAIASRKFAVEHDPRLNKIKELLPGANCGACGKPGCEGLAEDILNGTALPDKCRLAEEKIREEIAAIMGKKLEKKVKKIAVLHCNGGTRVKDSFLYHGIKDCIACNLVLGGPKECRYGCIGLESCIQSCPFFAITIQEDAIPNVNKTACKACNKCVQICPKKLFGLIPITHTVYVACSSHDTGKETKNVCPVGCIACKRCEKTCRFDAIHVTDNLAVIDYGKCTSCKECVAVCPMKTIRVRE